MHSAILWTIGAFIALLVYLLSRIGRREPYLPNGPPTVPLLGNLNIFPRFHAYLKLTEWARIYGGIYSLKMGYKTIIVLTDMNAVKELVEQHSQATADRPPMYIADLVTGGMHLGLVRYNEDWRVQRRVSHEILTQSACANHAIVQRAESIQLVHDCLTDPNDFYQHTNRYSFSVILSILFGKRAPCHDMQDLVNFYAMERVWQKLLAPGAAPPVDLLPIFKYIPKRFVKWKINCEVVRDMQRQLYCGLLQETQARVARGDENGCYMEQVLSRGTRFGLDDLKAAYIGGTLIEGGAGTSAAWTKVLILAMTIHPEVQRKAHEELDRVVGLTRMPVLEDLPYLPYIQAIIKEVHRWRPVGPLAPPHATTEEIMYGGYRIPAETIIFINIWGMSHDPEKYERPDEFWPDRWILHEYGLKLGAAELKLNPAWFGGGRRACPGTHLAHNSSALNTMNLLWAFDFARIADGSGGDPISVDVRDFEEGFEVCPKPFKCNITPRSPHHADLVKHEFSAARTVLERYEDKTSDDDCAKPSSPRAE